ncbi:MAG TPA: energy transducer TonB [Thermoanaerobaculia bacterium]|nr:energy transducer TonB [Thermoanaerobaculia bacterium]
MKHHAIAVVLRSLLVVVAACATLPAAATDSLATRFLLLAGHPAAEPGAADHGVLVIPGLVMPLGEAVPGRSIEADSAEIAGVTRKLESTLGLDSVEVLYVHPQRLDVGREVMLPAPSAASSVRVEVMLQGYNDELATYRVRFRDGRSTFVDSVVSVPRQKRALVGGLDGEEAPYLFLVVEPEPRARYVGADITPPRAVDRPAPQYTSEAREARIQGVVILRVEIDRQGRVRSTKVLKGLPMGLSESAAETVSRWRFEPALDADGEPIDVYYNITINFRVDDQVPSRVGP